ncbi:hypothetical protein [Hydrogenophaga sp.]|nr:hypothetical protein [Hydrogenophaga sp.]MDO9438859.1 hypothetical protein [Hydrogenophaga sp.]
MKSLVRSSPMPAAHRLLATCYKAGARFGVLHAVNSFNVPLTAVAMLLTL